MGIALLRLVGAAFGVFLSLGPPLQTRALPLATSARLAAGGRGQATLPAEEVGEPQTRTPVQTAPAVETKPAPESETQPTLPPGELYVNDRFGYALRRPKEWAFRYEPGLDIVMVPADDRAEIQVVARSFFDIRLQRIPEGPLTLDLRAGAQRSGDPFRALRRCLPPALRDYLQLFWLDAYVGWHTDATAEEYEQFKLESRRPLSLAGRSGMELVYTLKGRRRPGIQKIKTIIVAYDERICQLSYITAQDRYEDDLKAFHAVVNSLYMHHDRG